MADWSKPSLTDTYANFLAFLTARDVDVATLFSAAAPTNPVDKMVRWNATNLQFEQFSAASSTWTQLWSGGLKIPSVTLSADPTAALQAATKQYVDALQNSITAAQNTANAALPKTGGTLTGTLAVNMNTPSFIMNATAAAQSRVVAYQTNGKNRWSEGADGTAESGSNAGSNWYLNRYSDAGVFIDAPITINRASGLMTISQRPKFGTATPWDSANLPSPMSSGGGNITGDLNLWQNSNTGGDISRLVMTNAVTGLSWRARLNGSTVALEFINSAYNAVNAQFFDNGNLWVRGSITGVSDLHVNGTLWLAANWMLDTNGAQRILNALGDMTIVKGGGGGNNWAVALQRNDGANMAVASGNGDFYVQQLGWITGIINNKAPANTFHHSATVSNCGNNESLGVAASGNTLQLSLVSTNCNCNCACSCFPAGSLVLMADGTEKPIEQVLPGDMVMGPTGPVRIEGVDRPVLGNRVLMTMDDGSLSWSDEHLLWARRHGGREGWWGANPARWRFEQATGHVGGLFDDRTIMEGWFDMEFAHIDGWKSSSVQPVANADPYLQLYLPYTNGSPIIVNGYMVGARVNEFGFNYSNIRWEEARHNVKEQCHACLSH